MESHSQDPLNRVLVEMGAEHLDSVLEIERVVFSNPWRRRDFLFSMEREGSLCTVVLNENAVFGYFVGFLVDREFHLADFAVHPDLQGQGFGRLVLKDLVHTLESYEVQVVSLEVRASNVSAVGLYRDFGFKTMAIRKDYYSRPKEDALIMLLPIHGRLSDWVESAMRPPSKS